MLSLDAFQALMLFSQERSLGWEREEQRKGKMKEMWNPNPKHCEKVMCFDMSN